MARVSLATAWAWADALHVDYRREVVDLSHASGRRLAEPIVSPTAWPREHCAASDGYAVLARDCDGASDYNTLMLPLHEIAAGHTLPPGTDAVLPLEAAEAAPPWLEVRAPVAPGSGLARAGSAWSVGATVLPAGRPLRPQDIAALAAMGCSRVSVLCRPRVRLLVVGPKSGPDMLTPMLLTLLARDGAVLDPPSPYGDDWALCALPDPPDLWLIAGRSGAGWDDTAAATLQSAGGVLALHGLALHPGDTTGAGVLHQPGEPLASFVAYDMLAARLVRRLAGAAPALPYAVMRATLQRKIVSGVGVTEVIPIRLSGAYAVPLSIEFGLPAVLEADGFAVVGEGSEGHQAGVEIDVHLYQQPRAA